MRTGRWAASTVVLVLCLYGQAWASYTHSWTWKRPPDRRSLERCLADMKRIVTAQSSLVEVTLGAHSITLNGRGNAACEDFIFPGNTDLNSCTTNGQPYDAVVTACLITARDYFSAGQLAIQSDGDWEEWSSGADTYQTVLQRPARDPMVAAVPAVPHLGLWMLLFGGGNMLFWGVQAAMTVWMLIDIGTSSSNPYWFYVVLFFQPFGTWIYFFVNKVQDFRPRGPAAVKALSVPQLRYNLNTNPCLTNKVALADRLRASGGRAEARELYQQVLRQDDTDKSGLFGLGQTLLEEGDVAGAVATLEKLIKVDPSYRDYHAAEVLAMAQWKAGQREPALQAMERLVRTHPRFPLFISYARMLADAGRKDEAETFVKQAVEDFRQSPRFVRRMHRGWPQQAKRLLGEIRSR